MNLTREIENFYLETIDEYEVFNVLLTVVKS